MADSTIGSLPEASVLNDTSLLVIEQASTAMKLAGLLLKQYCQNAVAAQVAQATASATEASNSAAAASGSATAAAASKAAAALSETAAEVAQAAAEAAQALAEAAKADAIAAKTAAVTAKNDAVSAKEAAALSANAAATSASNAGLSEANASGAAAAAATSEANALAHKNAAASSATNAATAATNAAASATAAATSAANASTSEINAGTSATTASAAANVAESSAEEAAESQTAAAAAQTAAETAETNAVAAQDEAEAWATGQRDGSDVPSTDPAYHNNAKYYAEQAGETLGSVVKVTEQSLTDAEKVQARANIDAASPSGNYVDTGLAASVAAQLISTTGATNKVPYTFRTTGGNLDVGAFEHLKKVIGGTIVWNQLAPGSATTVTIPAGHVYYFEQTGWIEKVDVDTGVGCDSGSVLVDLTKMVGKTLADFIATVNEASPGVGVELVKALTRGIIDKMYEPGKFISVKTSAHKTIGFNQWDEQWESGGIYTSNGQPYTNASRIRSKNFCPCVGNYRYYCHIGSNVSLYIYWYDINKNYIEGGAYTNTTVYSPVEAAYFKIATGDGYTFYSNDICINLSGSGYRDGEYAPYEEHEYPLDPDVELRGTIQLDDNNNPYYDGDEYLPDGKVTRKYGIVDLGTLTWQYRSAQNAFSLGSGRGFSKTNGNVVCTAYPQYKGVFANMPNMSVATFATFNANDIIIKNSNYTTAASFKAAMSGVYLVYELATSTVEEASSYNETQRCNDLGTEMFVVDELEAIPVGHETFYQTNLRDKLQNLPENASTDGLYLVKQTGDKQELSELPAIQTQGTYSLKSVNGTLTWVAG